MRARKMLREKAVLTVCIIAILTFCAYAVPIDVNIYNDWTIDSGEYGTVNIYDTPPDQTQVTINGGHIYTVNLYDTAILNYQDGVLYDLNTHENTIAYVTTSECQGYDLNNFSQVHISNGPIGASISIYDNAQLHIYGYNLYYDEAPYPDWITGQWENGQSFRIILRNINGYNSNQVFLHEIPEPSSCLILFSFAFLARIKHKKRF